MPTQDHRQDRPAAAVTDGWDYLIVTASNDQQASAYRSQLDLRRRMGLLGAAREVLVVPDPQGRRVGSGGSTIYCLIELLSRHLTKITQKGSLGDPQAWRETLSHLRVLIVHAGGDSRRLPAYSSCGKLFIPVPGESDSAVGATLFDRQLPVYLALPASPTGKGQVVLTAGDALLAFDPSVVRLDREGLVGLGCLASPEEASHHGVYCVNPGGELRYFLQKPTVRQQRDQGAIDRYGQTILDIGVISLDAAAAVALLQLCGVRARGGALRVSGPVGQAVETLGMDFYREVCCAMGQEATAEHHATFSRASGSRWDASTLKRTFDALHMIPFAVQVVPRCRFLHFGTTAQLISSGQALLAHDYGVTQLDSPLSLDNSLTDQAGLAGAGAWVEACRVKAPVTLGGQNVMVGVDADDPLALPAGACLDVIEGQSRSGQRVWFVRCYGVTDAFKDSIAAGATFCGMPMDQWLAAAGARIENVWGKSPPADRRIAWDGRFFPAEDHPQGYRRWLWMFDPASASAAQKQQWLSADRYSLAEIAARTDQDAFFARRMALRSEEVARTCRRLFRLDSGFSASELSVVLAGTANRLDLVGHILNEAQWHGEPHHDSGAAGGLDAFIFPRIIHTLGSAVASLGSEGQLLSGVLPGLDKSLPPAQRTWCQSLGLLPSPKTTVGQWTESARSIAFEHLSKAIVTSGRRQVDPPTSALRADEIVWGRAPARLDLGGGWTDTPPYSLEYGGCVINAAVNLNGQPPIQAYARVIDEPVIRIGSIDLGLRIEITELEDLLDYRQATSGFALAKAALAMSGLSPQSADWPKRVTLKQMLKHFSGGIELTTLAAIPKGSGLGTSSIMGVVILAVIQRIMGRTLSRTELFHGVLQLEQTLTTGGGWQDQIGGAVDGVKVISAEPGLVPEAQIQYVPPDVLDPRINGGTTLLYYTGLTRLAKNILRQVVGRYLDRDRLAMATLRHLHALPPHVAAAMGSKDRPAFGRLIDVAWRLNKTLDPDSSNAQIEGLLERVHPHIYGAKLLGAGGGGFLLMICKSPDDAQAVRRLLDTDPPNDRARFFDFDVSTEGLAVTVC
jgi:galactokinase/mevalonate kinase-like predicted kinase